jgi:hypothetical protein
LAMTGAPSASVYSPVTIAGMSSAIRLSSPGRQPCRNKSSRSLWGTVIRPGNPIGRRISNRSSLADLTTSILRKSFLLVEVQEARSVAVESGGRDFDA